MSKAEKAQVRMILALKERVEAIGLPDLESWPTITGGVCFRFLWKENYYRVTCSILKQQPTIVAEQLHCLERTEETRRAEMEVGDVIASLLHSILEEIKDA